MATLPIKNLTVFRGTLQSSSPPTVIIPGAVEGDTITDIFVVAGPTGIGADPGVSAAAFFSKHVIEGGRVVQFPVGPPDLSQTSFIALVVP
jgi:hypothetical protein